MPPGLRAGASRALRAVIFLLSLLFAPGAVRAGAAQLPAGMEEGIYQLRLGDLAPLDLPVLVRADGGVFVPLRPVLELAGAPFRLLPDSGIASVARPRGEGESRLDVAARTIGPGRLPLGDAEAFVAAGELYLFAPRLGDLLEAVVEVDASALTVAVTREIPFPAQERAANQARRAGALGRAAPGDFAGSVPFHPRSGGGVVEWGVTSSLPDPWTPSAVDARLGVGVLGGLVRAGTSVQRADGAVSLAELSASYQRVFPTGRWVRQLQLGDIATGGPRPRSVRGFSVGNAPFTREAVYSEVRYAPQLPSGWEYEVYQNGRLLGFSGEAGGGGVAIPLTYGSTPVEVRMYGPAGERVRSEISYLVPALQLPPGRTEYSLGGGLCAVERECRLFSYLDLRRGIVRGVTLFGGAEAPVDSAGISPRPYGGASILPARDWALEVQGMYGSYLYGTLEKVGTGRLSGVASAGVTYPERRAASIVVPGGAAGVPVQGAAWHAEAAVGVRTGLESLVRNFSLAARANGALDSGETFAHLSAAAALRRVLLEAGYETTPSEPGVLLLRAGLPVMGVFPRWLQAPSVYAGVGLAGGTPSRWDLTVTAQPFRTQLSLNARWLAGGAGPSVSLGAGVPLRFGRAQTHVGMRAGEAVGSVSVTGAAAFGSGAGVRPLRYGGLGLSGVTGVVFMDANGNGRRDAGENAAADAAVEVGSTRVRTDASGRYSTWSVIPYDVARVRLDTATLADPAWVPASAERLLRPSPHMYMDADFPLVQTRELSGTLVAARDVRGVGGVTVEISAPGGELIRTLTFSDGGFYLGRVRPGEYVVRVSESSLRALGARSDPASVRIVVPAGGDQPLVEVPPIQIRRAR